MRLSMEVNKMKLTQNIIVIGAGHGGLRAAKLLAAAGANVTVYEKSSYEGISHDRTDCIEMKLFKDLGLSVPEKSYKGAPCSFIAPYSKDALHIWMDEDARDMTVERDKFAQMLIDEAETAGAKFCFETEVQDIILDGIRVCGVVVGGEKIYADLVIDASGMFSPFRAKIPSVCGITAEPHEDEIFSTWHGSFDYAEGVPVPEGKNIWKVYLKFMGKKGISWVNTERDNDAAVLIGLIGRHKEEEFDQLLQELRKENPIIGDKLIRGGAYAPITVRYQSSVLVSEGYCLVGDSGFMTIPLLGSGIANSIRAGQMLSEEIIKTGSVSTFTLWNYQRRYFKEIGAISCIIDSFKRALLEMDNAELKYFFESDIVRDEDVKFLFGGPSVKYDAADIIRRLKNLLHIRTAMGVIGKAIARGIVAAEFCLTLPKKYDLVAINRWSKKLDGVFSK